MPEVTFVLMTCGEKTEKSCLKSIESFQTEIAFKEVRNVCPQIVALNQMIECVDTEFFVALDSDMILESDAWSRIRYSITKHRYDPKWHTILFPLWDTLFEKKILALKVMRSEIFKKNLFKDTPTPDVEHYQRLTNSDYTCITEFLSQRPIGKHVVKGHHYCYNKLRDMYQTFRFHNFEWDSNLFMGGTDLLSKSKAHFDYFLLKWVETNKEDYLSCIAGMFDGLTARLEGSSKTLNNRNYVVENKFAIGSYLNWYTNQLVTNRSMEPLNV